MINSPDTYKNLLLQTLSPNLLAQVISYTTRVTLAPRDVLETPNSIIEHVYFYETALGSTIAHSGEVISDAIEVGICGREGISGTAVIQKAETSPFNTFIQIGGDALRMRTEDLVRVMEESDEFRNLLLRYSQAHTVQIGYTALANGRRTVLERMARWILMCHDRVLSEGLELTHEFLSLMLGVRRAGITTDMHVLEGAHAVINKRGRVYVRERNRLEHFAGDSYGEAEAEYERLIGRTLRRPCELESD
jgi:hypothetical protein